MKNIHRASPTTLLHRSPRRNDVATVGRGSSLKIGIPRKLFDTGLVPDPTVNQYAVTEDGLKFLVLEPRKGFLETHSGVLKWRAIVN
jgi:hypothetical protein